MNVSGLTVQLVVQRIMVVCKMHYIGFINMTKTRNDANTITPSVNDNDTACQFNFHVICKSIRAVVLKNRYSQHIHNSSFRNGDRQKGDNA